MDDQAYLDQLRRIKGPKRRPVQSVGEVLGALVRAKAFKRPAAAKRLSDVFARVVGTDVASHARVTSFRNGILRVTVSSAALKNELATYRHDELVRGINAELEGRGQVASIQFRFGRLATTSTDDSTSNHADTTND